jgi:hypothetical protein
VNVTVSESTVIDAALWVLALVLVIALLSLWSYVTRD